MSVIYMLITIGILVAGGFLLAFIWSVRSGQYDDDYTPSVRMLFDNYKSDEEVEQTKAASKSEKETKPLNQINSHKS